MNSISTQKLRNVPKEQRLELIDCFTDKNKVKIEIYFVINDISSDVNLLYKSIYILINKNIFSVQDFLDISNHKIIKNDPTSYLNFVLPQLSFYNKFNISYSTNNCVNNFSDIFHEFVKKFLNSKDINKILEILEDNYCSFFKKNSGKYLSEDVIFLIDNVPGINKYKMIDLLIYSKNTAEAYFKLKEYKNKLPPNSLLKEKIEGALAVYEII